MPPPQSIFLATALNPIWGGQSRNPKGRLVEQLTLEHDLIIFNDGRPTRVSPASNTKSSIDLCIGHQQLGLDYRWDVLDDTHGSDHYPTMLIHTVHKNRGEPRPRHWVMRKADHQKFKMLCEERLSEQILDNNNPMSVFIKTVYDISVETIPKSPAHPKKIPVPWFDEECRLSILEKKRLNQRHVRHSTMESKIARNRQISVTRRLLRQKRRDSWRRYVSALDTNTTSWQVWQMVRKISGRGISPPLKPLKLANGRTVETRPEIANEIAKAIAYNSSSENLPPDFIPIKIEAERVRVQFDSDSLGDEFYNSDFSMDELKQALSTTKSTAPGPDDITNDIIKLLPETSLQTLIETTNAMWRSRTFPQEWREATVIPLPKPEKEHSDPNNYRPISLTSCICKLVERMVNNRLMWYLESENLLSKWQCGARKNRSTLDQLVRLDTYIREALAKHQHVVSVFFDIEQAYDSVETRCHKGPTWDGN